MIRVLIADDNAVIRQGVRALLTSSADDIEVVGEAATGREAIEQAELLAPDVVLCVADDGVGIDGDGDARSLQTNGHYGLIGMAERGERIGATVQVAGQRGAGTTVTVRLPAGDVRAAEPWALEEVVE